MDVDVIVLNGASSAGKSSLAACLQARLEKTFLVLGVDDLIRALSHGPTDTTAGGTLEISDEGVVAVGEAFRAAERAWFDGLAAMSRLGVGLLVDEVFLDGGASQARLREPLEAKGLSVAWIGVRCAVAVAEARERRRSDRHIGMTRQQAGRVHEGVHYDFVVDTSRCTPDEAAAAVASWLDGTPAGEATGPSQGA